jgi:hypothetical protein
MADRSTLHDQQYRPVSTVETAANDGLSVRAARDIAMGINNAVARVCSPRLTDAWPGGVLTPQFYVAANDTAEHVVMPCWPAVTIGPHGHYTHAAWSVVAYVYESSNNCVLRLYSCERYYRGSSTVTDATRGLMGAYSYDELTAVTALSADAVDVLHSGDGGLLLRPNEAGQTYYLLTATFAAASANNGVVVLQKTITPGRVLLDWAT